MKELLKELMKAVRKDKRATINVKVEGIKSEILIKGDGIGILTATKKIIQSVRKNIIDLGIDEERSKEILEFVFKKGMEETDE